MRAPPRPLRSARPPRRPGQRASQQPPLRPPGTGARRPPRQRRRRPRLAALHAGGAPRVVATGGTTRGATRSEAAAIAEGLRARGVPDVIVEDRSRSTDENATCTAALIGACSIWLVTQPFHGRRAARLFRRAGFDPHVWHIADSLQYRDRRRALRWVAREYAAWAALLLRGR